MPTLAFNNATLYTTANNSTVTGTTWQAWNQAWTALGTVSGSITVNSGSITAGNIAAWTTWNGAYTAYVESEEARVERERREQENRERWNRVEEERKQARARAEELLLAMLSDEQSETWRRGEYFTVRGSRSGRTYRIRRGIAGNVDRLAEVGDQVETVYCAHPPEVPAEDVCLAQMLLLSTDEEAFLRVANVHSRRLPDRLQPVHAGLETAPVLAAVA